MKIDTRLVSVSLFALALASCGSPEETDELPEPASEVDVPEVPATPVTASVDGEEDDMDGAAEDGADTDDEADAEEAASTPTPTPTPTRTAAATPSPTPTQAAAAAPRPPIFAVCGACHAVEAGNNGIGPSLAGVFGAKAGHVGSFDYSDAMKDSGLTWNEATLNRYLENPRGVVPGTTMSYAGLKNDEQRQAVIDYLKGL